MDRELFEKLQQEATALIDRMSAMNLDENMITAARNISNNLNNALVISPELLNVSNFSVNNEIAKKSYVTTGIANLYIDAMVDLINIENQVNSGNISYVEAMTQLRSAVQSVEYYSKKVANLNNDNLKDMARIFKDLSTKAYATYKQYITSEELQRIRQADVPISSNIRTDTNLEAVIDENEKLIKQTLDKKKSSNSEKDPLEDEQINQSAQKVLDEFYNLTQALESSSNGDHINFDVNKVIIGLSTLNGSMNDLTEIIKTSGTNTSYTRYLSDMSEVFSEKTRKTRSALADFQTGTFESSIPQIRKLIEETKSQDEEKSEILKRFTKNAAWYMQVALMNQGQNNSHVNQVMKEVEDIIRSANTIGNQHELEAKDLERKQTKVVNTEVRNLVYTTVIEQILNSNIGPSLSKKQIEEMADKITDETINNSDIIAATDDAVNKAINSKEKISEILENTDIKGEVEAVVADIVTEEVKAVEKKKEAEQPAEQTDKVEKFDMDNTPITKTKEEIAEDYNLFVTVSILESKIRDSSISNGIAPDIIESSIKSMNLMINDDGNTVVMKDGTIVRISTVVKQMFSGKQSIEKLKDKIAPTNASDILDTIELCGNMTAIITPEIFNTICDEVSKSKTVQQIQEIFIPENGISQTFDSENMYISTFAKFSPLNFEEKVSKDIMESNNSISDMYTQINSRMETFQNSRNGNTTSNETMTQVTPEFDPSTINIPGIEPVSMPNPSVDFSNSMPSVDNIMDTNTTTKHPLDRYRELLEKYDIQFITDANFPAGRFVALDRTTNQPPQYRSREERDTLIRDLSFAKSWVSSCGTDLSKSGGINEYGIDPRQWEYSFNDGAQATFDWVVDALKNNSGPNLRQKVIDYVTQNSNYKYANSIVDSLLRDRNNKELLNNIHTVLLNEAGISSTINQISPELDERPLILE